MKTLKQFIAEAKEFDSIFEEAFDNVINEKLGDFLLNRDVDFEDIKRVPPLTAPGGGGIVETDDPEFQKLIEELGNMGKKIGVDFGNAVVSGMENFSKVRLILGYPKHFNRLLELGGNKRYSDIPNMKEIKGMIKDFVKDIGISDRKTRKKVTEYFIQNSLNYLRSAADTEYRYVIQKQREQGRANSAPEHEVPAPQA